MMRHERFLRNTTALCESQPLAGFWEYVEKEWKKYLPKSEAER